MVEGRRPGEPADHRAGPSRAAAGTRRDDRPARDHATRFGVLLPPRSRPDDAPDAAHPAYQAALVFAGSADVARRSCCAQRAKAPPPRLTGAAAPYTLFAI